MNCSQSGSSAQNRARHKRISSVQSLSRVRLFAHKSQHTRPPCPSPAPGVYSNSCPSSQWCHPAISSSVVPFSSCPQSLPASGSFSMSQFFAWGGQSIRVSASVSVLPMNTQDWSPLGWTKQEWEPTVNSCEGHNFGVRFKCYPPHWFWTSVSSSAWTWTPYSQFRLKLKKVGKTTRPFRYDINQIPYDYTVEVGNRFMGLDLIECLMNYGQRFVTLYRRQGSRPSPWKRNAKRQNGCLRRPYK